MQPTMAVDSAGDKIWRLPSGRWHREDGPAVELVNGDNYWYLHDSLHRTDGSAIEEADGDKEWWLYGERLSFSAWLEANTEISDEQQVMLKLQYG